MIISEAFQLHANDFADPETAKIKIARICKLEDKRLEGPLLDSQGCANTAHQLYNIAVNKELSSIRDKVLAPTMQLTDLIQALQDDCGKIRYRDFKFYYLDLPFAGHHAVLIHDGYNAFILQSYIFKYSLSDYLNNFTEIFSLTEFINDLGDLNESTPMETFEAFSLRYFNVNKAKGWIPNVMVIDQAIEWSEFVSYFEKACDFTDVSDFKQLEANVTHPDITTKLDISF